MAMPDLNSDQIAEESKSECKMASRYGPRQLWDGMQRRVDRILDAKKPGALPGVFACLF
jgi:hypothetical protein